MSVSVNNYPMIWWFGGMYRVHCERIEDYKKMMRWVGAERGSVYSFPDGHVEFDVDIPEELVGRAEELLHCKRESETAFSDTALVLCTNDLRDTKSPLSESN